MRRTLSLFGGLALGLALSQFPEYAQQYTQRLGGAVDELRAVTRQFDAAATAAGLSREQALARYGLSTDTPVTGDFDGDGKTDIGIFGSNGNWAIEPSSKPGTMISTGWGMAGDIPILKDYDGDGKTDISVWRPSDGNWYTILSSKPTYPVVRWWGMQGDIPLY